MQIFKVFEKEIVKSMIFEVGSLEILQKKMYVKISNFKQSFTKVKLRKRNIYFFKKLHKMHQRFQEIQNSKY